MLNEKKGEENIQINMMITICMMIICMVKNWKKIYQKNNGDYPWVWGLWVTFFSVFWYFKIVYNEHILLCLMR